MKKHSKQVQQHERAMETESIQKNEVSPKNLNRRSRRNFLITFVLALAFCGFTNKAMGQTYSGGSGTESDPYLISSKADMEALADAVNYDANYSQGKYFFLTMDITEAITTVIGNDDYRSFQGTFDGGGHSVNTNISTNDYPAYAGVFGYLDGATVKNLKVNGSVYSATQNSYYTSYGGGICGYANYANIINCSNAGDVKSDNSFNSYAGGICGYANNTTITSCSNSGSVTADSYRLSYDISAKPNSGGICGSINNNSVITNCSNTGNVVSYSGSNVYPYSFSFDAYAGGICGIGDNNSVISNCIASNTLTGSLCASLIYGFTNGYTGRIIASGSSVQNCYALASMSLNDNTVSSQDANNPNGKDIDSDDLGNVFINMDFSTCSQNVTTIMLTTTNTVKWQRSTDNEQSWTDITCTSSIYTETDPAAGEYIYRALNGNGTWSNYVRGTYSDAIPAVINTLPLTSASQRVDEGVTFSLELTDNNYNYQWYKGDDAIYGATSNTYSIPVLKMSDAGIYHCQVWNGCNTIASSNTMLVMDKATQTITLPETTMTKAYGDADFDLPAVTEKNQTIAYSSSNTNVATITDNKIHITGTGVTTITAAQAGNSEYLAASPVTLLLTITQAPLTITAQNATRPQGQPNPTFTFLSFTKKVDSQTS